MNLDNHPCFNAKAHKAYGRVHLPVAPRCNIQCKFCNRRFDCVNESRPGVTSAVLKPHQAMIYLDEVFARMKNISVVGIAGPGDPFANPEETMETLERVRSTYPDIMLCVATNGLNLLPYINDLARLKVSHVTVTVNALTPDIGEKIYSWARWGKRVLRAREGVEVLLANQIRAVEALKAAGLVVKVNSIILPGINDHHIPEVARKVGELGVDIVNCVPYHPARGSSFENMAEPSKELVEQVRRESSAFVPMMRHCTRCRSDAVGLLGQAPDAELMSCLSACESIPDTGNVIRLPRAADDCTRPIRNRVAVASMEGMLVNQHLGEAEQLLIFEKKNGRIGLLESRPTPEKGSGDARWEAMSRLLGDCKTLLVSGVGERPKKILSIQGLEILEVEGIIEEAVSAVFDNKPLQHLVKHVIRACQGRGGGCG